MYARMCVYMSVRMNVRIYVYSYACMPALTLPSQLGL